MSIRSTLYQIRDMFLLCNKKYSGLFNGLFLSLIFAQYQTGKNQILHWSSKNQWFCKIVFEFAKKRNEKLT